AEVDPKRALPVWHAVEIACGAVVTLLETGFGLVATEERGLDDPPPGSLPRTDAERSEAAHAELGDAGARRGDAGAREQGIAGGSEAVAIDVCLVRVRDERAVVDEARLAADRVDEKGLEAAVTIEVGKDRAHDVRPRGYEDQARIGELQGDGVEHVLA